VISPSLHLHDQEVEKWHDWDVIDEPGVLREDLRNPQPGSEWDQNIDFDTAPLSPETRKTAVEHLIIRARLYRGPEVIAVVCLHDASLDIFCVELFGAFRCDEDIDILGKKIT
jgi:hypothetical protein